MDKTSSSIPPIILLQFLHMAFPQFAEKGEQGQYLQQVKGTGVSSCKNLHYLCDLCVNVGAHMSQCACDGQRTTSGVGPCFPT